MKINTNREFGIERSLEEHAFFGDFDQDCFSHGLHVFGFEVELGEASGKIVSELAGEDSAITAVVLLWHFVRPGLCDPVIGQF